MSSNLSFVLNKVHDVSFEEREVPRITSEHDVLVAVNYTGICGSDVHYYDHGAIGHFVVKDPMVLGHESAGTIVDVGSAVKTLVKGDRVALEPGYPCRRCADCLTGNYNLCHEMTSQSANHDDAHWKTVPQPGEANIFVNAAQGTAKRFAGRTVGVQLADHDIGRVRDDGAEDTGQIATGKGDAGLGALAVVALLARQAVVDHLDNGLERCKLHHGVGDLTTPERVEALVQPGHALLGRDGADAVERAAVRRRDAALHAHLDSLKGTEGKVGEELGRSGRSQIQDRLVLLGILGTGNVRVLLLEELIPAILEGALGGVAEQRRAPAGEDAAHALAAEDLAPGLEISRVQLGVDLATRLDEVKRGDGKVREALQAGQMGVQQHA
ncbi:hypothetical protein BN1708_001040 [Verticillium longisporum]|uniref:D-xylulose reductase n=1 Tax=Verticillium longisporum TaxID=100787 RepID=A0A0G4MGI5_VERLO|nr:hypothetical protein BN1708_001040 [Verticillium longisporum]